MQSTCGKLHHCQQALSRWSAKKFCNINKAITQKTRQLEALQCCSDPTNGDHIKLLQDEINHLLEMEDLQWKQRAKRHWFCQGDRNTKFFHAWANHRRKTNQIEYVIDELGVRWTEPEDVDRVFVDYFQSLYSTASPSGIEANLSGVPSRVTEAMNF